MATLGQVQSALRALANKDRAKSSAWFFKTGPGQYGEGDKFLGVTVPQQRKIAKQFAGSLTLKDIEQLMLSPWHEERLTAIFMLVIRFQKGDEQQKTDVAQLYLARAIDVNNWDLVDSSAGYILGPWLETSPDKMKTLRQLAKSSNIWERRIAMISTSHYIAKGQTKEAFIVINLLKHDSHDLIQKAVGWMLREIGKRADQAALLQFLDNNASNLPRTTLRYAIERLQPERRAHYLSLKNKPS